MTLNNLNLDSGNDLILAGDVYISGTLNLIYGTLNASNNKLTICGGLSGTRITSYNVCYTKLLRLVAQYFGAGEKKNASRAAFQAILISFLAWPVILLLKPLGISFFQFLKVPESQFAYQVKYFNLLAWGALFVILRQSLSCYFSGIGKTGIVMRATIVAMFINVVLDYILIFGKFGIKPLGIEGAAIASISGSFGAVLMLVIAYFRKSNSYNFV